MSKTFNTLGNDTVDVFFDHRGFPGVQYLSRAIEQSFRGYYADRHLGSLDFCEYIVFSRVA